MWTNNNRFNYLGTHENFLSKYCRLKNGRKSGTLDRIPENYDKDLFRMLILQISYLMPYAVHSTPNWSHGRAPKLILKFGVKRIKKNRDEIIGKESCGFCTIGEGIYFWMSKNSQAWDYVKDNSPNDWSDYADNQDKRVYFNQNLNNAEIPEGLYKVIDLLSAGQRNVFVEYIRRDPKKIKINFDDSWVPSAADD